MEEPVFFEVPHGPRLEGSLDASGHDRAGLVVCHPHPVYGGDMDNPVVTRTAEVAREAGLATLRFNFRGAGASEGVHDRGAGEQDDVRAAVKMLRARIGEGRLGLAGYSFGAWVSARVAAAEPGLAALGLIAPPVAMLDFDISLPAHLDVSIVAGTRDEYCPPNELARLAARIPHARAVSIDGAEHFFFGKLFPLGEAIRGWIAGWATS